MGVSLLGHYQHVVQIGMQDTTCHAAPHVRLGSVACVIVRGAQKAGELPGYRSQIALAPELKLGVFVSAFMSDVRAVLLAAAMPLHE